MEDGILGAYIHGYGSQLKVWRGANHNHNHIHGEFLGDLPFPNKEAHGIWLWLWFVSEKLLLPYHIHGLLLASNSPQGIPLCMHAPHWSDGLRMIFFMEDSILGAYIHGYGSQLKACGEQAITKTISMANH